MILLHDILNRKDEITRTRFVETFSARQIDVAGTYYRWTANYDGGTGTVALADLDNYGLLLTGTNSTGASAQINHRDYLMFSQPCSAYFVTRMGCGSNLKVLIGLGDGANYTEPDWGAWNRWEWGYTNGHVFFETGQNNSTGQTTTNVTVDENFHSNKIFIGLTTSQSSIDGVLRATRSAITPRTHQEAFQPLLKAESRANETNRTFVVNYFEAWNN